MALILLKAQLNESSTFEAININDTSLLAIEFYYFYNKKNNKNNVL